MIKHECIELLAGLEGPDLKSFSRFIRSPYFNQSPILVTLFNTLREYHPDFSSRKLTKEYLYASLYGERKFSDTLIRYNLHHLARLLKEFLMVVHFRNNSPMKNEALRMELAGRDMRKIYYRLDKQMESDCNESMLEKFKRTSDRFYFDLMTNEKSRKNYLEKEVDKLKEALIHFTGFFITESVKHNGELLNYSKIYNIKSASSFVRNYVKFLNLDKVRFLIKNGLKDNSLMLSYVYLLKAFLNFENVKEYYTYRNHLIEHYLSLSKDEVHFLFGRLVDYCVEKINSKDEKKKQFAKELAEVYNFMLLNKCYQTKGNKYLPDSLFRNIVVNYCRLKKFEDAEEFVQTYRSELARQLKDNIVNHSYANINFEQKNYHAALGYLKKVDYKNFNYRLDYRMLLIKIHFEMGKYVEVIDLCDAFKQFINSNMNISEEKRAALNSFINYVIRITKAKERGDDDIMFLKKRIENNKALFQREWLEEKIAESKVQRKAML